MRNLAAIYRAEIHLLLRSDTRNFRWWQCHIRNLLFSGLAIELIALQTHLHLWAVAPTIVCTAEYSRKVTLVFDVCSDIQT